MKTVESVPLGKLLTVIRNGLNTAQYDEPVEDGMLPISRIETIAEGAIDFQRVKYASVSEAQRDKYQLRSGDILFSHINSPAHIGKTAIFRSDQALIHGVNLLLLRPDPKRCHPEYLNYYLRTFQVRAWFRARCKKAVNQASLNHSDVKSIEAPLPPLPEQQRIAAILGRADRLRRLRRTARELGDTYLQSVFLEMFGDPVTNLRGWERTRLSKQIKLTGGYAFKSSDFVERGIPLIRIGTVNSGVFDDSNLVYLPESFAKEYQRFLLYPGNLVITLTGTVGKDDYGNVCVLGDDFPRYFLNQRVAQIIVNPESFAPEYVLHAFRQPAIKRQLTRPSRGIRQANINNYDILGLYLPSPPLSRQQQFAHIVHKFERLRAQQREAERQAEHLFQALLHRAFRGEV